MNSERSEHVFVVRLWREAGAEAEAWRGCIDHVGSGERRYFADLGALDEHLRSSLQIAAPGGHDAQTTV